MVKVSQLKHPENSHRKQVLLPKHSKDLAEFFGIMIGDGGINNDWQFKITMNSIADKDYSKYVLKLVQKLFKVEPSLMKRKNRNAMDVYLNSVTVVDFLVDNGLIRGNKLKQGLKIPKWILKNREYSKVCVRGLFDTDGCMYIHTHKVSGKIYRNIGLQFTSYSKELIFQVAEILDNFGIMPHITKRGNEIYIYQADMIKKYLKLFGTSNSRISSVYNKWRDARAV